MMRGLGVDTVIVVDVEDKDASVWRNLSAYDGGISGWRLLWDRWCPIPSLRSSSIDLPLQHPSAPAVIGITDVRPLFWHRLQLHLIKAGLVHHPFKFESNNGKGQGSYPHVD